MIGDILATRSRPSRRPDQLVRRLSHPQLYTFHLASHYTLKRSSMVAREPSQMGSYRAGANLVASDHTVPLAHGAARWHT
jgi:hypothetical protein